MGVVIWHVTMSLDGFIAGPDDAMDWVFGYIPLDARETKAMLEEARTASRSAEGAGRRVERAAICNHAQCAEGRRGCVDQVSFG